VQEKPGVVDEEEEGVATLYIRFDQGLEFEEMEGGEIDVGVPEKADRRDDDWEEVGGASRYERRGKLIVFSSYRNDIKSDSQLGVFSFEEEKRHARSLIPSSLSIPSKPCLAS
jgi:hypothetical protein